MNNTKIYNKVAKAALLLMAPCTLLLTSCNDWLDVRPDTEQKEDGQFSTEKGFQSALTGCYIQMASTNAYGLRLTMTSVENLANLWYINPSSTLNDERALSKHEYTSDYAKSAISSMYTALFKAITQANLIIKNADEHRNVFTEERMYNIVKGEALAIRAYCQLDILRLFGQMPKAGSKTVKLPYSAAVAITDIPQYYSFEEYVAKLESDIKQAEELLKDTDPATIYPYNRTYATGEVYEKNDFLMYRQMRLNYWAVRALHARMALYTGDKATALAIARDLIKATLPDGTPVRPLSGKDDYNKGYLTCPNECYFSISKYDIKSYTEAYFTDNEERVIATYKDNTLAITHEMLDELFAGERTDSHNRYKFLWNQRLKDDASYLWCGFLRYSYDDEVSTPALYYQIIPMLRTSEMYLIIMETSDDLAEINTLYNDYMVAHNVAAMPEFTSLTDVRKWIEDEYRREFYAEGQMFYTYKRLGETSIKWLSTPATEATYVLPLPETEYDPALAE